MLNFLLGISITFNLLVFVGVIIALNMYLKKSKKVWKSLDEIDIMNVNKNADNFDIFSKEEIADKDMFNDFFGR